MDRSEWRGSRKTGMAATALAMAGVLVMAACGDDDDESAQPTTSAAPVTTVPPGARADLLNAQGQSVGEVVFREEGGKTTVEATVRSLPPGFHGFHIHAVGRCEAPFTTAGAHVAIGDQAHAGHAGDQPSLMVTADGTGQLRFATDRYKISDLLTPEGRAVIVHADADNFANIPARYAPEPDAMTKATGDAGARVACGVIKR